MPAITANLIDVYPYRQSEAGAGAEFLLLRRAPGTVYEGQWRMVGGKIESGETAAHAAVRELVEETGARPKSLWAVPSLNTFFEWESDNIRISIPFAAQISGPIQLNHEHDDYAWLSRDDAVTRLAWPEQQRLLMLISEELAGGIPVSWRVLL
ncbi:MAG: NUDIX pyrophosphatase [Rhodothermia bacterium]|nr:NUDIX pyrophosphatase [Rhodothermia bacterium]